MSEDIETHNETGLIVPPGDEISLDVDRIQERDKKIFQQVVARLGEPDAYGIQEATGLVLPSRNKKGEGRYVDARVSDRQIVISDEQMLSLNLDGDYLIPGTYKEVGLRVVVKKPIPEDFDPNDWDNPDIWRKTPPLVVVEGDLLKIGTIEQFVKESGVATHRLVMLNNQGQTLLGEQYKEIVTDAEGRVRTSIAQAHNRLNGPITMHPDFWPKVAEFVVANPLTKTPDPYASHKPLLWGAKRRWSQVRNYLTRRSDLTPRLPEKT